MYTLELYVTEGERKCTTGIYECHHFYVHYTQSKLPPCVCVGILAAAGCLRWLQYKLLFDCDKWTWRKTPPQSYGYLFKGGLHSNQQIHRKDWLPIPRHKKVQKKRVRSLSYIHFWRQTQYKQQRWMNWSEQVVPLLILKHGCGGGVSVSWRGISANQLEAFFYRRLMKIIVECCRMISWLDLQRSF